MSNPRRERLSYAARGLLVDELMHLDPHTDSIAPKHLVTPKNRVTGVRTLLDELTAEGFLRRWRAGPPRDESGQIIGAPGWAWRLYPDGDAPPEPERE